jgi:hypothetical protein
LWPKPAPAIHVGGDFLGCFDGLGQFALGFADLAFQSFDGIGFGLKEGGDEVGVRNQGVMPADRNNRNR